VVDQPPVRPWQQPRPCKDCGGLFTPKWSSSRRCDSWHEAVRDSPNIAAITSQIRPRRPVDRPHQPVVRACVTCGLNFPARWPGTRRCDVCHAARDASARGSLKGDLVPKKACVGCGKMVAARRDATSLCHGCHEANALLDAQILLRSCVECGAQYPSPNSARRHCDACYAARAASARGSLKIVRERLPPVARVCLGCGATLNRSPAAKRCVACAALRERSEKRARRARNAERYRVVHAAWKAANRGRLNEYKRDYDNQRKRIDHVFKLVSYVRSRVATALRASRLKGRRVTARGALRYLGCPFDDFARHIESQFTDGMSWENFGKSGWHVDHIYPLARADFADPVELLAALNWRNCRPLWEAENMIKSDTITAEAAALFAELKETFSPRQLD
jgi:hypothetical protein